MPRLKGSKNKKFPDIVGRVPSSPFRVSEIFYQPTIKLTLKSVGRIYKSEGETLEEALRKIKITGGAKAMCVLRVEKGDLVKERIMNGNIAHKAFGEMGPTMKDFAIRKMVELIGL